MVTVPAPGSGPTYNPTCTQAEIDSIAALASFNVVPLASVKAVSAACQSCVLSEARSATWTPLVQLDATTVMVNYATAFFGGADYPQCPGKLEEVSACLALACGDCDTNECRAAAFVGPCAKYSLDSVCATDLEGPGYAREFPHDGAAAKDLVSNLLKVSCVPG